MFMLQEAAADAAKTALNTNALLGAGIGIGLAIVGLGIGLTFPVLSAAAVSSLPPQRFGVGSAVNQTARQIGGAIGIAVLVMILGDPQTAGDGVGRFDQLWAYAAAAALLSGAIGALIPGPARAPGRLDAPGAARTRVEAESG